MNILKYLLSFSMTLAIGYAQGTHTGNIEQVTPVLRKMDSQQFMEPFIQTPQMIVGYKPEAISLYSILRCGPDINRSWFVYSICIKWGFVPKSELQIIAGGHPAEFGNDAQLSKSVNRIPSWRYEGPLKDTQLMTLNRTRYYRYRNSIL